MLPPRLATRPVPLPRRVFVAAALRTGMLWRLAAMFLAVNGVPLVVSAWLVAYLMRQAHVRAAVAGGLAFVLFGLTTLVRPLAPRLARGGRAFAALAAGGLLIAAAGLVVLAASRSVAICGVAVVLMGTGFALPYAVMIDAAGRLFPGQAAATLVLVQTGPNVMPIAVIPLVGSVLGGRHAPWAFVALAAFVAAVGVASLHQPPASEPAPHRPVTDSPAGAS